MNNNTEKEVWKAIDEKGFEGFYEVSNIGRVRSLDRVVETKLGKRNFKGRILSTPFNSDGYPTFNLCNAGVTKERKVHQVVARAFIPNPNGYLEINHIDENKSNNHTDNLEWCTREHNMNHGTIIKRTQNHPNIIRSRNESKRSVVGIRIKDRKEIRFKSIKEADRNGYPRRNLWSAINGLDKSLKGYVWCYEEDYSEKKVKELLKAVSRTLVAHIDGDGNIIQVLGTVKEASEIIGTNSGAISRVCNGIYKSTKGYKLKYIKESHS